MTIQFCAAHNHLQARPPPPSQQVPWVPGNAWYSWSRTQPQSQRPNKQPQQNQQGQAQVQGQAQSQNNPYKRVLKRPSAEYMAMRLSDNPLGLSDTIPRYVFPGFPSLIFMLTMVHDCQFNLPCLFLSRTYLYELYREKGGSEHAEYEDANGRRVHEPRGPIPSRKPYLAPEEEEDQAGMSCKPSSNPSSYSRRLHGNVDRQSSEPIPSSDGQNHKHNPSRHSSEPSSLGRPSASASVLQPNLTTPYPLPPTDPN